MKEIASSSTISQRRGAKHGWDYLRPKWCSAFVLLIAVTSLSLCCLASVAGSKSVHCGQIEQKYLYYSPDAKASLPVVMLLHGAGDRPENMIDAWKRFATKQGITLLAPELPRVLAYEDVAPGVFRCVVEDAKQWVQIDAQRVYLFGNSMGGYLAFDGAMFESQYFAAAAVHANRIADDYTSIVTHATRKTPIAIYIGDHDQFFSVESVIKTRDLLRKAGFLVHYVEFVNHDHDYYAISDEINSDAWKFLKENTLPVHAQ